MDVCFLWGESEFDGGRGDDLGDGERASSLVVEFLHGVVGEIVLKTEPHLVSNFVFWCTLMVPVVMLLHFIHCMFKCSLHLLLGVT